MVKVRMLVSMAGLSMREPGQVIEVDENEGKRLIAAGFAVREMEIETTSIEAPEKAVLPTPRRKAVK